MTLTQAKLDELTREMLREMSVLLQMGCGTEFRLSAKPEIVVAAKGFLARAALMGREGETR